MRITHRPPPSTPAPGHSRARDDRGYILVTFAALLVPLLLMVGLAVDVGGWYSRTSDIQKAADAAALAGVVWLPDEALARQYALEAAARNGFPNGGDISTVVTPVGDRRLQVTITDRSVSAVVSGGFGIKDISLTRSGVGEYVLPVPLGSPRNFLGTGQLDTGYDENLWLAVNTWCTDKVDGDRYQSPFVGIRPYPADSSRCPDAYSGAYQNSEYRDTGYLYYVDVPTTRTGNIEVLLHDPQYLAPSTCTDEYLPEDPAWTGPSGSTSTVTITGPAEYRIRSSTGAAWQGTVTLDPLRTFSRAGTLLQYRVGTMDWDANWTGPSGSSSQITIDGPKQYQTRTSTGGSWSSTKNLATNQSFTRAGTLLRYKDGTIHQGCAQASIDLQLSAGTQSYDFDLYSADTTPLNDADNPLLTGCSGTYSATTPRTSGISFLGTNQWNRLCTITTGMPTGRYIMRVTNTVGEGPAAGSNNFSIVAKYTGAAYTPASALCDARTVATCPRVYGKDAMSIFADQTASTADFYLAEIAALHTGKKLVIDLFDPGEGGNDIRLRRPTGADSWTDATFSWRASDGTSGGPTTSLDVTNSKFNGDNVQIIIDLAGYNPPSNNNWWQVRYNFGTGTVTDRTTWSAKVLGDPVHLIELG